MIKERTKKNKISVAGFTLIELMLSIVVIAILSGVLLQVVKPSALKAKARDTQRISDIRRLQAGLEMYFANNRKYPMSNASAGWVSVGGTAPTGVPAGLSAFISPLPTPPTPPTGIAYKYASGGSKYTLVAQMEIATSANGACPTTPAGLGLTNCYTVINP